MDWVKKNFKKALVVLLLTIVSGCGPWVRKPPATMLGPDGALLAISVRVDLKYQIIFPSEIFFIRKDASGEESVYISRYSTEKGFYLFNVEPGTYRAVAASYVDKVSRTVLVDKNKVLLFPLEMVELTTIEVKPGDVNFMGHYRVKGYTGGLFNSSSSDKTQRISYRLLLENKRNLKGYRQLNNPLNGDFIYGEFNRRMYDKNKRWFLREERKFFKGTSWQVLFPEKS